MALCGSYRCGCGLTSTPAVTGAVGGELPSIVVSGSGEAGDPFDLLLNDAWASEVAERLVWTCTSATRPTGVEGRVIFETDTDLLLIYDGSAWVTAIDMTMTTYTPTLTNITIGDGTQAHSWKSLGGKTILVSNVITFGTTTSLSGWPLIAPPAALNAAIPIFGQCTLSDAAPGNNYVGAVLPNGASQVGPVVPSDSAAGLVVFTSATAPFTWASTDVLRQSYIAELA